MIGQNYKSATWAKNEKKNKKMSLTVIKVPSPYPSVPSTYPPRTLPVPSPYPPPAKERRWDNVTSLICKKICNDLNDWYFCRFLILYVVNPWADSAKLRDDVGIFWNARITSNRSEISAVTWRVLAPNYQTWRWEPVLKVSFVRFQSVTLASNAKRQRYSVAGAFEMIFDDGSEHGGISSGEESELHKKMENLGEESR